MNPQQTQMLGIQQLQQLPLAQQQKQWVSVDKIRALMGNAPEDSKTKYENGVRDLLTKFENAADNDPMKLAHAKKLTEVSYKLKADWTKRRQQAQQQAQAQQQQQQQQQASMGMSSSARGQETSQPVSQPQEENPAQAQPQAQGQGGQNQMALRAHINQLIQSHVADFPFNAPPNLAIGSPEAEAYIRDAKSRYIRGLTTMETQKANLKRLNEIGQERQRQNSLTAAQAEELKARIAGSRAEYEKAKAFVEEFRSQQAKLKEAYESLKEAPGNQGISASPVTSQAPAGQANIPVSSSGGPQIPSINTAVNGQSFPQQRSAEPQSASQNGPVRSLSHSAAISEAARLAVDGATPTSNTASGTFAQTSTVNLGNKEMSGAARLPIPKQLPTPNTRPVSLGPTRPTYTGGASNSAIGVMGQPGFSSQPSYNLGNESERILSKKKIQELCRQVTGQEGGTGVEFSAEVEEAMYDTCDDFLDDVIDRACKLAKIRGSQVLELRDVQMVLERTYNMRIPGYTTDEIRVVRKIAPAHGWTQKMSAIQAAKVTKDKADL